MRNLDDLTMYAYGLLDETQNESVEAHLDSCADCSEMIRRIGAEHRFFKTALMRERPDSRERSEVTERILARRPVVSRAVTPSAIASTLPPELSSGTLSFLRLSTAVASVLFGVLLLATSGGRAALLEEKQVQTSSLPATEPAPSRGMLAYVQDAVVGSIAARDDEGRPVGDLGLKSHHVTVEILDGIAKTTVDENFQNHTDRRLEGVFHFPLPPDASISRLALDVNGKIEEGTCLERERAREVFESIVRKMKDPALLEWMPGGIFKCRIFPIEPRATKRVIVAYTQALPFFGGRMSYVYPLVSEKTKAHPPEDLRIDVRARFSGELRKMESPSHLVDVRRKDRGEAALTFAASNARPRNDFVVALETSDEELRVIPHKMDGDDGYFALILTPQGAPERRPGRYVFVLDVSASVTAPELEAERRVVRAMMEKRIPGDRFEILASNIEVVSSGDVDLRAANDFMDRLVPLGGSDLLSALGAAPEGEIIYIGKGAPTFGETDPAKILEAVKDRRIRTIGVGSRANVDFLQKLGGHFRVNPSDDVPRRVAEIAATLGSPVLSEIRVDGAQAIYDVVGLRDIFYGERLVATGRYRGPAAKLVVTGRGYRREIEVAFPPKEEANNYVRRLWAQRKIADLLAKGESKKPEVTELGVRHQIMTPYTSFLVLENEQMWKDYQVKRDVQKPDLIFSKGMSADPLSREPGLDFFGPQFKVQHVILEADRRKGMSVDWAVERTEFPEVRTTTNQFGGLQFSLGEASRSRRSETDDARPAVTFDMGGLFGGEPAPLRGPSDLAIPSPNPSTPQSRFSLVSNGAPQSIDLPRIPDDAMKIERVSRFSRVSNDAPQSVDLPRVPDDAMKMETRVSKLKYFQPAPVYTAKVEQGKFINGQPVQPAADGEEAIRRSTLVRVLQGVLTKDMSGRTLGKLEIDPATNVLIVRDTPAVLDKVSEIIQALDVEPAQVILDFHFVATTNEELLKSAPSFQLGNNGVGRVRPALNPEETTRILGTLKQDRRSRLIQEPTLAVADDTEASIFIGETTGFQLYVRPKVVPEANKVILAFLPEFGAAHGTGPPQPPSSALIAKLVVESGKTEILRSVMPGRREPGNGGPAVEEKLLIFVNARIVPGGTGSSDSLKKMLKAREEEEMRELAQKVETRPKVLSANEMTNEVVLDADSAKGAAAGQLFAISRDQKFVAIVEIRKTADDHSSGGVWRGLAMGRVLPGDRAERVGDVRAFLSALPEEVRRALAARENLETIRTKMRLRE